MSEFHFVQRTNDTITASALNSQSSVCEPVKLVQLEKLLVMKQHRYQFELAAVLSSSCDPVLLAQPIDTALTPATSM